LNRIIWLGFFAYGAFALVLGVRLLDNWAMATAVPGAEAFCRGTLAGEIPITRAPLCFAVWFAESKTWLAYARDMLLHAERGMHLREWLRAVEIAFYAIGTITAGIALAWLWATAMTRVVASAVAGSYLLLHAVSHAVGGRGRTV
jgi:hypothetical protein